MTCIYHYSCREFFHCPKIICALQMNHHKTKQTQRDQTCGCQDAGVGRKDRLGGCMVDANYHI